MSFRAHPYRSWLLLATLCALLAAQLPVRWFVVDGTATTCDLSESIATASIVPGVIMPPVAAAEAPRPAPASLRTAPSSDPFSILRI